MLQTHDQPRQGGFPNACQGLGGLFPDRLDFILQERHERGGHTGITDPPQRGGSMHTNDPVRALERVDKRVMNPAIRNFREDRRG